MSKLLKSKIFLGVLVVVAMFGFVSLTYAGTYTMTLKQGMQNSEVLALQAELGVTPNTGYFGTLTKAAVMAYQTNHGLVADGIVGPLTRAALAGGVVTTTGTLCPNGMTLASNCTTAPGGTTTGTLCPNGNLLSNNCAAVGTTGGTVGVGTVDQYSLISSLSNEEVGEGLNDVKIYGLDIEVGEGSDISLTAVKLLFNESDTDTTGNFDDYADDVSVWLGSTEIGTVDASKFTDDNAWTYTVGLSDAEILAGTTGKLYVAVSGIGNLDSADATDDWTLDVTSIRWVDGQGAMISEDPGVAARTFTFENTAVAADAEFKISSDVKAVNDAHVLDIDATEATTHSILSFKVKVEGTGDIMLKDIPVLITVATQDHVDEMVQGLDLWMDGEQVSSVNMTTDCNGATGEDADCIDVGTAETYVFHDIDTELTAGNTYHFLVKADIFGNTDTPGDVAPGDTIRATFGETQTELASFDAELDGTNLVNADKTGTVTGSASEVRESGINVALVSATATKTAGEMSVNSDAGLFTITFDVTAFGADMYIDATAPTASGGTTETDVNVTGAGTLLCTITSPTGATLSTSYLVTDSETERFAVTCDIRDGGTDMVDGFFDVAVANIAYAIDDAQTANLDYTFNLGDFKTPQIFLNDWE